jgi:hypothetical protein
MVIPFRHDTVPPETTVCTCPYPAVEAVEGTEVMLDVQPATAGTSHTKPQLPVPNMELDEGGYVPAAYLHRLIIVQPVKEPFSKLP